MKNIILAALPAFLSGDASNPFWDIVEPVVELLEMVVQPAMWIVGAIGSIYCIILGVKLARAEEQQDRDKAKGALKNAIIGFVSIFVLIVVLNIAMPSLAEWATSNLPN